MQRLTSSNIDNVVQTSQMNITLVTLSTTRTNENDLIRVDCRILGTNFTEIKIMVLVIGSDGDFDRCYGNEQHFYSLLDW